MQHAMYVGDHCLCTSHLHFKLSHTTERFVHCPAPGEICEVDCREELAEDKGDRLCGVYGGGIGPAGMCVWEGLGVVCVYVTVLQ